MCPQCIEKNTMTNEWAATKKDIQQLKKALHRSTALVIGIVSILIYAVYFWLPVESRIHEPSTLLPTSCFATGSGLEMAVVGEKATASLYFVDQMGKGYNAQTENVVCELLIMSSGNKVDCAIKKNTGNNQYEISYEATSRGRHQLHIKVEGEHIKGSPFNLTIIRRFDTPIKIVGDVETPHGLAFDHSGGIVVAEYVFSNISIFHPSFKKRALYPLCESTEKECHHPNDVAVDGNDNIIITDQSYHCIMKLKPTGELSKKVGKLGSNHLEFNTPFGIAIHPINARIYISEVYNHRIHVLNHDLTLSNIFGSQGTGEGQLDRPRGIAFDISGNLYIVDSENHRIQVFTSEGIYLRKFGRKGGHEGELYRPWDITIDDDGVVYVTEWYNRRISVFTTGGKFLTTFGNIPGQIIIPRGIAVDQNGIVYVSDVYSNILLLF